MLSPPDGAIEREVAKILQPRSQIASTAPPMPREASVTTTNFELFIDSFQQLNLIQSDLADHGKAQTHSESLLGTPGLSVTIASTTAPKERAPLTQSSRFRSCRQRRRPENPSQDRTHC
jgi:hypothetical protein